MKNISYSFGNNSVFIFDHQNNKPIEITNDRINYKGILDAIKDNDEQQVRDLMDESQVLCNMTNGRVRVTGDQVFLDGDEIHTAEAKKLTDLIAEGHTNLDRWFRFIEKLNANPSHRCRQQAYNLITHTGMCMTEEGNLIGYKGVQDDYYSKYGNTQNTIIQGTVNSSGQILNTVGSTIEMPRKHVDDDPNNGCSSGLHVGSHDYADSWASSEGKLLIVEYSPQDIVSVPNECEFGKLRVCKYRVIEECTNRKVLNDGAYGHESNELIELFDFIDQRVHDGGIWLNRIKEEFPETNMDMIMDAIRNHSEYFPNLSFDSYQNDWLLRLEEVSI